MKTKKLNLPVWPEYRAELPENAVDGGEQVEVGRIDAHLGN